MNIANAGPHTDEGAPPQSLPTGDGDAINPSRKHVQDPIRWGGQNGYESWKRTAHPYSLLVNPGVLWAQFVGIYL